MNTVANTILALSLHALPSPDLSAKQQGTHARFSRKCMRLQGRLEHIKLQLLRLRGHHSGGELHLMLQPNIAIDALARYLLTIAICY